MTFTGLQALSVETPTTVATPEAFAARATSSFPGAFPPFTVGELDGVLAERDVAWPGREDFLRRSLPRQYAARQVDKAVLIDGSVLANAPFRPAIAALKQRPARREIDRRFVYIDPKPDYRSISFGNPAASEEARLPGFLPTILGALSEIPREQPIRDNLETIEARSRMIRRMRRITETLREEIEIEVESAFGGTLFLDRPTPARLAAWRSKAQTRAASAAGFAYPAYAHLKLSQIVEEIAAMLFKLGGDGSHAQREAFRQAIWGHIRAQGLDQMREERRGGARPEIISFFRDHDLGFRIRRLRFMARRLTEAIDRHDPELQDAVGGMRRAIFSALATYQEEEASDAYSEVTVQTAEATIIDPGRALDELAAVRDLKGLGHDASQAAALAARHVVGDPALLHVGPELGEGDGGVAAGPPTGRHDRGPTRQLQRRGGLGGSDRSRPGRPGRGPGRGEQ